MTPRTPITSTRPLPWLAAMLASSAVLCASAGAQGPPLPGAPSAAPEPTVVLSTGSVTLRTRSVGLLGHALVFTGLALDSRAGHEVIIQRYRPASRSWVNAAGTQVKAHGAFKARWVTNLSGRVLIRALVTAPGAARVASSESSPPARITIYRPSLATYFGAGFYGKRTACGQLLTPFTLGVANRTLPCGTLVDVSYGGRHMTVPVIDRGPYANGANWDLTEATAQALEITETARIGTLLVGRAANTPDLGLPPGVTPAVLTATGGTAA